MKKMNIDLAQTYEGCLASPCCTSDSAEEKHYPNFHYCGPKELDIPKEGTMTIRFRRTHTAESERKNGKVDYDCNVDVLEIVSVDGAEVKAPSKSYDEASSALDKLMSEMSDNDGDE